jgi:hypothetical protein
MVTGGCVLKTGKLITTEFMFAKYSQVPGLNSQLQVSGKVILQEAPTLIYISMLSKQKKTRRQTQLYSTLAIVGSTTPNLD